VKRVRLWGARAAFFASVLALLGTAKPAGWRLEAQLAGPTRAPANRGLLLTIDATHAPHLRTTGGAPSFAEVRETPCSSSWSSGRTLTCLVRPGVTIDAVEIRGGCGGCQGACPPPANASLRVTSAEIDVEHATSTSTSRVTLPAHGKDRIATTFEVLVSGADAMEVRFQVLPHGSNAPISTWTQACHPDPSGRARCFFLVFDSELSDSDRFDAAPGTARDVDVIADVDGWTATGKGRELRVESLRITP
jgi:hypothetical protein